MSFKQNLLYARHHLVFMAGLLTAFGLAYQLEKEAGMESQWQSPKIENTAAMPTLKSRELSPEEMEWAKTAWKYFQVNYQEGTGLVNAADKFPSTTMWDTATYLLGLISAHRLGIVGQAEFDTRTSKVLQTLANLPLFENSLPNKSYNTITLEMVDYNNHPTERGIGWSAIDIGRILTPLNILIWNYPQHDAEVRHLLTRWNFAKLLKDSALQGAALDDNGQTIYMQEGRLGYEQYAAKSLALMGYDVINALQYGQYLKFIDIYDVKVPTDNRNPEIYHAHNYVVSEPYILDGLEYGWDSYSREFAYRVYAVQEQRFIHAGILTAVSEDNIDEAPYFVYNTVFTSGKVWNTITDKGVDASNYKSISTKAAIGWHALYQADYTQKLIDKVKPLYDNERGWYSGFYEIMQKPNKAITANTNGIILESLCYQKFGKLVAIYPETAFNSTPSNVSANEHNILQINSSGSVPAQPVPDSGQPAKSGAEQQAVKSDRQSGAAADQKSTVIERSKPNHHHAAKKGDRPGKAAK